MAIDFVVHDAAGKAQGAEVPTTADLISLELGFSEFPLLAGLAPWGKTVFNRKQAGWLKEELVRLRSSGRIDEAGNFDDLISLCEQVSRSWHLYLVALGD